MIKPLLYICLQVADHCSQPKRVNVVQSTLVIHLASNRVSGSLPAAVRDHVALLDIFSVIREMQN